MVRLWSISGPIKGRKYLICSKCFRSCKIITIRDKCLSQTKENVVNHKRLRQREGNMVKHTILSWIARPVRSFTQIAFHTPDKKEYEKTHDVRASPKRNRMCITTNWNMIKYPISSAYKQYLINKRTLLWGQQTGDTFNFRCWYFWKNK